MDFAVCGRGENEGDEREDENEDAGMHCDGCCWNIAIVAQDVDAA